MTLTPRTTMNPTKHARLAGWLSCCLGLVCAGCARHSIALDAPGIVAVANAEAAQAAGQPDPKKADGQGFTFPGDKGGQALGQVLRPPARLPDLPDLPPGPHPLRVPPEVDRPGVLLVLTPPAPVLVPQPKGATIRPRTLAEAGPLSDQRVDPAVPALRELTTGARIVLPGRDVHVPVALGYLGLSSYDRVPLDDPTTDASLRAALEGTPPPRISAVPFTPHNLPDPFQNAQTIRLRSLPPEAPDPAASTPRPPAPEPKPK